MLHAVRHCASTPGRLVSSAAALVLAASCAAKTTAPVAAQPSSAAATTTTPMPTAGLESLSWMAGTWATQEPVGPRTEEHWLAPAGGTMLGVGRTVLDDRTVFFEFLRIVADEDGIAYLASPLGRDPATRFALHSQGTSTVTFANPDHDFPQTLEYRRDDDLMHVQIGEHQDGHPKRSSWTLHRMPAG